MFIQRQNVKPRPDRCERPERSERSDPLDELFDDEFELELFDEFELEFDELLEDEFELDLLDEFELELLDELELELLDEFDELLPATMIEPSPRLVAVLAGRSTSIAGVACCFASAIVTLAAIPAISAGANILYFVMGSTPLFRTLGRSGGVTGDARPYSIPIGNACYLALPIVRSAAASSLVSIGGCASIAAR